MANIGTTQIVALHGELSKEWLPIAATQSGTSTISPGYPVYLNSGVVTIWATPGSNMTSATPGYGIADFKSVVTVNGVSTALALGVLVPVYPFCSNVALDLPTVNTAPNYTTDVAAGANTTGFQLTLSSGGLLQVDTSQTASAVVRPYALVKSDWSLDGVTAKSTGLGSIGDRYRCVMLAAGKQVLFG